MLYNLTMNLRIILQSLAQHHHATIVIKDISYSSTEIHDAGDICGLLRNLLKSDAERSRTGEKRHGCSRCRPRCILFLDSLNIS
jgi:hypothetical protein